MYTPDCFTFPFPIPVDLILHTTNQSTSAINLISYDTVITQSIMAKCTKFKFDILYDLAL